MTLEVTIDAQVPSKLASFWAQTLPSYAIRPYDAAEIARLAALGLTPETDTSVAIDGDGPTIWFQQSKTTTHGRNRLHFDLAFGARHDECERLRKLGASVVATHTDHIVMQDPEGNQFCLFDPKDE